MKLRDIIPFTRKGYRSLKTERAYIQHRRQRSKSCDMCNYDKSSTDVVEAKQYWLVIENIFPYRRWDWRPVRQHLMIIPTRHMTQLSELNDTEWQQFNSILSRYDTDGYSTYLRSSLNKLKTVAHLHWHLIKTS